jgi:twinkle protein
MRARSSKPEFRRSKSYPCQTARKNGPPTNRPSNADMNTSRTHWEPVWQPLESLCGFGDADGPGRALRADMARLMGVARFRFVDWPEGTKDANDFLVSDGADALRDLVENGSLPWPVPGLYRLAELPEPPPLVTWQTGFADWNGKIALAPGTLSIVTGHPGHGKSVLWTQIWYQIVRQYGVPVCVASFETKPKPHMRRQLRTLISGELEKHMSPQDMARADDWINERYVFAVHPDQRPTLEWLLDIAEVAIVRHGARIIQIDPWNRIEATRPNGESETDYIGRCLRAIYAFANDMSCHVQIIAHPAKMDGNRKGSPPLLEDIAGSKHWDNMPDQGFVVHRPELFSGTEHKTQAQLFHHKARYSELGHPCKVNVNFQADKGRFVHVEDTGRLQ